MSKMHQWSIITEEPAQTRAHGRLLGKRLHGREIVCCFGEMGAGKTTFVQGLAQGIGIAKGVWSPSFVLVREHHGRLKFFHVDAHRLEHVNSEQVHEWIDLENCLERNGVIAIEWAEHLGNNIPSNRLDVYFEHLSVGRRVTMVPKGKHYEKLVCRLKEFQKQ